MSYSNMIKEIKYNRLHKDVIIYFNTLRNIKSDNSDLYYIGKNAVLVIRHIERVIYINTFYMRVIFDDELLKTAIPKLLKCENYRIIINN